MPLHGTGLYSLRAEPRQSCFGPCRGQMKRTRKRVSRSAPRRKARAGASPPKRRAVAASLRPAAPDDPPFLIFWHRAKGTLPEKIKKAHLRRLNSGLSFLFGRLRQAQARFEQEGDSDRQSVFSALGAFWSFITLFKGPLAENLHRPNHAIARCTLGARPWRDKADA